MKALQGKVAVVTGAASGIGAATARRFAEEGAHVFLGDISTEAGMAIAREIGATFLRTDVRDEAAIEQLIASATDRHGRLDVIVNNAGALGVTGSISELDLAQWNDTAALLLTSVFLGIKHASKVMIPQGAGAILATASTASVAALGPHCYSAMKTAILGLVRSAAAELSAHGITVNGVAPGVVATGLTSAIYGGEASTRERSRQVSPLGRGVEPGDIANAFLFLASEQGRNVTGQTIVVDGGITTVRGPSIFNRSAE